MQSFTEFFFAERPLSSQTTTKREVDEG